MIKEKIYPRDNYLEILTKRVSALPEGYRQNLAIIGDEQIGKTTLLFDFLSRFCDNRILPIYLEIRPEAFPAFAKRFIGIMLYNFLLNSGIPLKENLEFLILKSQAHIPKTIEKIKNILLTLEKKQKNNIFSELLGLCDTFTLETQKSCVVIFDEFHNLDALGIKNLYREWSKMLVMQKSTLYIITSSLKFKAKAILANDLSLLFGNFELVHMEPFDIKTSERYLEEKLKDEHLNSGWKNFIVHFTGGHPLYLKIISDALKDSRTSLSETLEALLFDSSGILNQRFSNLIKRFLDLEHVNDYLSMLYLISCGNNRIKDISHILHKQKNEITVRVNHLLELDTITRNGDFLKINDRVFSFWLKFVHQEKSGSLTFNAKNQKEKFRQNIEAMIQEFLAASQKPVKQRIFELLRLFENEMLQFEKKRIRLNHFREIKPLEFNNRSLCDGLIGRSQESLWILAFKNEILTESDITDFARECKKYRSKTQRKIIVSLQDIDANTRLRAMEEKIWAWDINNLNQMLDLFSKPRVIA